MPEAAQCGEDLALGHWPEGGRQAGEHAPAEGGRVVGVDQGGAGGAVCLVALAV
jgi:hypothetical protein